MKNISRYLAVFPLVLGGITLSFVLAISVWSVTGNKLFFQTQSKAGSSEDGLSFAPNAGTWKLGASKTLGVLLTTGDKAVTGLDLTIKYDPNLISVTANEVLPGSLFENVLVKKVESGKIFFSAVTTSPGAKNGILMTLVLKSLKRGRASLEFAAPSDVMEASTAANILNKTIAVQFDIQ